MRREDDDPDHDLVRADAPLDAPGPEALARLIDQSNREQAASRAQARELIKALEGVQRSPEYLGEALHAERRKSRGLLALLLLGPIAAAVGAWYVLRHVDDVKLDVERRVDRLAADEAAARADESSKREDARTAQLAADVEALRRDLQSSREALAAERKHVADRENALATAETKTDNARMELVALESEVKSARSRAHAEEQRAGLLETKLKDAQSALTAKPPPIQPTFVAPTVAATSSPPVAETKSVEQTPPSAPAPTDPSAAEKARAVTNALLKDSGELVRYEFTAIRAVSGKSLLDVVVVGADAQGAVVRTIQAGRAEIVVDSISRSVVLRFYDGKLLIGGKQAPFFDGTYGLVVRGEPAKWKAAALSFVKTD